ncbi:hypothetical protein BE21_15445 [Sorangium cellulosum]|uniref:Uncharacterized protein n=1 Tax=Sorangium cellulosum TaxID=56 RepID=A0A150TYV7_SORCE|nr:hypothetical protein BE21_15445 [Sorangium cellulosum]
MEPPSLAPPEPVVALLVVPPPEPVVAPLVELVVPPPSPPGSSSEQAAADRPTARQRASRSVVFWRSMEDLIALDWRGGRRAMTAPVA